MAGISRRTFVKGAGAATGAAVVGGGSIALDGGPVQESKAIAPIVAGAAIAGGAAVGYLMNEAADKYLGDTRDYSGYTGGDALILDIVEGAHSMASADERVMTSIQNNITTSANVALAKGKAAIIEQMNAGASQSEAQNAKDSAVDGYYATIQTNILTHVNSQTDQIYSMADQLAQHPDVNPEDVFDYSESSSTNLGWSAPKNYSETYGSETLLDGSTVDIHGFEINDINGDDRTLGFAQKQGWVIASEGYDNGFINPVDVLDTERVYQPAYDQITTERDNVITNLTGFVSDVYSQYDPGQIPTEDLIDPITAATELSQNYDGYQFRGAQAAMLGIPTSKDTGIRMTIHYEEGDSQVLADMFTDYQPTDGSGNPVDFRKGTTYDPSTWDKPLYIAYEYTDSDGNTSSDFIQLETSFTIDKITTNDGEEIDNFRPESRNVQTADISKLEDELQQIRQEQIDMQNEAEEETSGGGAGGGFFADGGPPVGVIAAAGGGLALLYGLMGDN